MATLVRPSSDVSNTGGYTTTEGSLFDAVDDSTSTTAKYIQSVAASNDNQCVLGLPSVDISPSNLVYMSFTVWVV